jgi:hypothetical protein
VIEVKVSKISENLESLRNQLIDIHSQLSLLQISAVLLAKTFSRLKDESEKLLRELLEKDKTDSN